MFRSATFKLTAWYLIILIMISLLFSVVIYSLSSSEVRTRIAYLQQNVHGESDLDQAQYDSVRDVQVHEAEVSLLASLAMTNIAIWLAGGIGSYYLARRTLRPIEKAHIAQSRFTSDASHELRTPLASMKTELEVALRDPKLSENEMHELLASNLEEVDKLTKLSQNLLQLSRLDHESIKREKVTLHTIATAVTDRLDRSGKRVRLSGHVSHAVMANKSNIEELFTILLDNALKYSPKTSQVTIALLSHKQMTGFEVTNDGPGIPEDALLHIFDRFYRADSSRTGSGYGLGLSLAKKIVELHNGELSVRSGVNRPTTFRVLLPRFKEERHNKQT